MTRENRNLLINSLVALLFGVVFLFGYNAIIDAQAKNEQLNLYKTYFPTADSFESVTVNQTGLVEKVVIKKGNSIVGYFYVGSGVSTSIPGHGGSSDELRLHVFVKANREIEAIKVDYYEHTSNFVENFLKPDLLLLEGVAVENYLTVDLVGGASAYSMPIVHQILTSISRDLTGNDPIDPIDPYFELFGEYETVTEDTAFTPTAKVLKREIVKNASDVVLGYAYTVSSVRNTGTGSHLSEYIQGQDWELTLLIGVNTDLEFVEFFTVNSDHTGSYYGTHEAYYESLEGVLVDSYDTIDTIAGATASRDHILELLEALKGVL